MCACVFAYVSEGVVGFCFSYVLTLKTSATDGVKVAITKRLDPLCGTYTKHLRYSFN